MPYLNSSAIAWADYEPDTQTMHIRLREGTRTYTYYGVPEVIYHGLITAHSAGRYYDRHIKDRYG